MDGMSNWKAVYGATEVNPFTLRVSLESIVCYFQTFENNLGKKEKFSKYLKGSC